MPAVFGGPGVVAEVPVIAFLTVLTRLLRLIQRSWKDPEFRGLFILVILVLLLGTLFYSHSEGWTLLDSLYFSVITLTTIGYGDLYPTTAVSKVFTILYVFIGLGIILAFLNSVAERALERQSMNHRHREATRSTGEDAKERSSQERE